jgi:ribosome-binding factor A
MVEKTNELLKAELGKLILEKIELPNVLITITTVMSSEDLGHADIFVSVLPEGQAGTALSSLKKQTASFSKAILSRTRLRHVPRIHWHFDAGEIHATSLDAVFKQIEDERNS